MAAVASSPVRSGPAAAAEPSVIPEDKPVSRPLDKPVATKPVDTPANENKPVDKPASENEPVDKPASENKPVDNPAAPGGGPARRRPRAVPDPPATAGTGVPASQAQVHATGAAAEAGPPEGSPRGNGGGPPGSPLTSTSRACRRAWSHSPAG